MNITPEESKKILMECCLVAWEHLELGHHDKTYVLGKLQESINICHAINSRLEQTQPKETCT